MRKSDFLSLRFTNGSLFSSASPWKHSSRVIDSFELILVTKGTVWMQQDGEEYTLSAGEYLLLSPGIPHGGTAPSEMPVEFYWLHFAEDPRRGLRVPPGFGNLSTSGSLQNPGAAIQTARQLLHCGETTSYPPGVCDHLMVVLFAELISQNAEAEPRNALAARVREYIRSHRRERLTAAGVAEVFGYNADYLSRILKRHCGRTLQQDIDRERLNDAKLLLQTSDYTVQRVAMELGYDDPNLFVKFFRYHLKMSPTAYRSSFTKLHTNHL